MVKRFVWVMAILLAVACGKDNSNNNNNPVTPGGGASPEYTSIQEVLRESDRRNLVGKTVDLRETEVRSVVGTYTFWVGDRFTAIPVVRGDRIAGPVSTHVRPGGRARIRGTLRLVDRVEEGNPMWDKVNENERKEILNAGVYILAEKVEPLR